MHGARFASVTMIGLFALFAGSATAQTSVPTSRAATPSAPYESDPKYISAMHDAKEAIRGRNYTFIADAYKKANKVAGGRCVECLEQAYEWQMKIGEYKDAVKLSSDLIALASTPSAKSLAEFDHAEALLRAAGDKPKPAQLETVHAEYQTAINDFPKNLAARYHDGCVLARLGKMDDASKQFSVCAEAASPADPTRIRARHFAENPALSLSKMAPSFTVTALDGSRFTLDEMGGRVVLIDFWATWCGPCNQELPHMKKIAKEFAGQPLVIISVSWDSDEAKWKSFVAKNEMNWVQYRDTDHSLSKRFGIEAIPHYFTIDSDGVLTAEMLGSGSDVEGKLKKLIARAAAAKHANAEVAQGN